MNKVMKETSDEILKKIYVRKENNTKESPWVNNDIRPEIKLRKELNRKKRNERTDEDKEITPTIYGPKEKKFKVKQRKK